MALRHVSWVMTVGALALGYLTVYQEHLGMWDAQVQPQLLSSSSSISTTPLCTPARILYFNLQPSLYGRDAELPEFREAKTAGFDITLANRNSMPTITKGSFDIYNVLWLHGGCAGEAFPLKAAELSVIRAFYLKGGSLIIDAGDNYAGGVYGPAGANCQDRANQIAMNLGVQFSGRVQYATSTDGCRPIQTGSSPLLTNVTKVFRESSGEMKLLPTVSWGKTKPVFVGTIDATGAPVFAAIAKEDGHGGAVFSPQDQGMQIRCSGQNGTIYKNIFKFLGHELNCKEPQSTMTTTEIPGAYCQVLQKSLYGSGAVRVACPQNSVIMGGGWNNGISEITDYSRPFETGQGWECHGNKEDTSATCSAVCCDSYYYDSIVTVRDGVLNNKLTPTCPQNYSVVGGGFDDTEKNKDEDILKPSDDISGWQCYDDGSDTPGSRCFAICAKRKDASDPMVCKTVSTTAGQDKGISVLCPKGSFITGGGFEDRGAANKDQDASMPTPGADGWYCEKNGNKDGVTANICYARCCTLPEVSLLAPLSARSSPLASSLSVGNSSRSLSLLPLSASSLLSVSAATSLQSSLVSPSSSSSSETPPSSVSFSLPQILSSANNAPASSAGPVVSSARSSVSPVFSTSSMSAGQSSSSSTVTSSVPSLSSQRTLQASSVTATNICQPDACRRQGDAYCKKNGNLKCAEIGTTPCFVCLAEVGFMPSSSRTSHASLPIAATVETQSNDATAAVASSRRPVSSSVQSAARSSATPSSAPAVLQATLLAPWYPSASDAHIPLSASGPGTLGVMAAGAVSGLLWMRKRRK